MPNIDLSILNQRQTPAFFADTLANRPAAGFLGRIFVSTDTFAFYRDNGTGWDLIGGPGTGTITGTGASGQIALWNGASTITGDTGLTYDGTANSLTADKFIVSGGTSSQFLKANGSVDSNSYVPYTGANASLNMGANNLLGQNYFINGNDVNSGGFLGIKQFSGSSSGQLGYTSISALTQNSLYFQFSQTNGTNKRFELSTGLLGTTIRQFLLPDADGTLALTSNIPSVSGAASQVAFFSGTNAITGENNLWWDSVNNHFGINTNVPGTALDVHHDQSTIAILNQTVATNDARIGFQNNGVGLWRIGAFYNAGANDFGIFDAVSSIQPLTIKKTTGQVLIGTSVVGSGRLVVANTNGDSHIQIVGASAPSLRIDSAESGPTKRIGIGISTATNNFIQGSADRDMCIFNGSTTASPILFGIYDTTNVQEAARISAARNFLIGTTTDNGQKLQINGNFSASGVFGQTIAKSGSGVEDVNFINLRLSGTNAIGDSQNINFLNNGFQTISRISGIIGADNVAYGSISFSTRNFFTDSLVEVMRITNKGYVGINVTSPTALLELSVATAAVNSTKGIRITNPAGTALMFECGSSNDSFVGTTSTSDFDIRTNNTQRIKIGASSGNILIGTSTDSGAKLRVVGGNIELQGANANSKFIVYPDYSGSAVGVSLFNTSGVEVISLNGNAGNINITGSIITGAPSGGTAQTWKLGGFTSGAAVQGGKVRVEINGVAYDLLTT
jgi:hypothetical protein